MAKIEEEREITNLNILIDRPRWGEQLAVCYIERIDCAANRILYRLRTPDARLDLTGRAFAQLSVRVLLSGTRSFTLQCDDKFTDEMLVARYKPAAGGRLGSDGELISVAIVP